MKKKMGGILNKCVFKSRVLQLRNKYLYPSSITFWCFFFRGFCKNVNKEIRIISILTSYLRNIIATSTSIIATKETTRRLANSLSPSQLSSMSFWEENYTDCFKNYKRN